MTTRVVKPSLSLLPPSSPLPTAQQLFDDLKRHLPSNIPEDIWQKLTDIFTGSSLSQSDSPEEEQVVSLMRSLIAVAEESTHHHKTSSHSIINYCLYTLRGIATTTTSSVVSCLQLALIADGLARMNNGDDDDDIVQAIASFTEAATVGEQVKQAGGILEFTGLSLLNLSIAAARLHRHQDALRYAKQATDLQRKLVNVNEKNTAASATALKILSDACLNLANLLESSNQRRPLTHHPTTTTALTIERSVSVKDMIALPSNTTTSLSASCLFKKSAADDTSLHLHKSLDHFSGRKLSKQYHPQPSSTAHHSPPLSYPPPPTHSRGNSLMKYLSRVSQENSHSLGTFFDAFHCGRKSADVLTYSKKASEPRQQPQLQRENRSTSIATWTMIPAIQKKRGSASGGNSIAQSPMQRRVISPKQQQQQRALCDSPQQKSSSSTSTAAKFYLRGGSSRGSDPIAIRQQPYRVDPQTSSAFSMTSFSTPKQLADIYLKHPQPQSSSSTAVAASSTAASTPALQSLKTKKQSIYESNYQVLLKATTSPKSSLILANQQQQAHSLTKSWSEKQVFANNSHQGNLQGETIRDVVLLRFPLSIDSEIHRKRLNALTITIQLSLLFRKLIVSAVNSAVPFLPHTFDLSPDILDDPNSSCKKLSVIQSLARELSKFISIDYNASCIIVKQPTSQVVVNKDLRVYFDQSTSTTSTTKVKKKEEEEEEERVAMREGRSCSDGSNSEEDHPRQLQGESKSTRLSTNRSSSGNLFILPQQQQQLSEEMVVPTTTTDSSDISPILSIRQRSGQQHSVNVGGRTLRLVSHHQPFVPPPQSPPPPPSPPPIIIVNDVNERLSSQSLLDVAIQDLLPVIALAPMIQEQKKQNIVKQSAVDSMRKHPRGGGGGESPGSGSNGGKSSSDNLKHKDYDRRRFSTAQRLIESARGILSDSNKSYEREGGFGGCGGGGGSSDMSSSMLNLLGSSSTTGVTPKKFIATAQQPTTAVKRQLEQSQTLRSVVTASKFFVESQRINVPTSPTKDKGESIAPPSPSSSPAAAPLPAASHTKKGRGIYIPPRFRRGSSLIEMQSSEMNHLGIKQIESSFEDSHLFDEDAIQEKQSSPLPPPPLLVLQDNRLTSQQSTVHRVIHPTSASPTRTFAEKVSEHQRVQEGDKHSNGEEKYQGTVTSAPAAPAAPAAPITPVAPITPAVPITPAAAPITPAAAASSRVESIQVLLESSMYASQINLRHCDFDEETIVTSLRSASSVNRYPPALYSPFHISSSELLSLVEIPPYRRFGSSDSERGGPTGTCPAINFLHSSITNKETKRKLSVPRIILSLIPSPSSSSSLPSSVSSDEESRSPSRIDKQQIPTDNQKYASTQRRNEQQPPSHLPISALPLAIQEESEQSHQQTSDSQDDDFSKDDESIGEIKQIPRQLIEYRYNPRSSTVGSRKDTASRSVRGKSDSLSINMNEERCLTPKIKQKRNSMLVGAISSFENQLQMIDAAAAAEATAAAAAAVLAAASAPHHRPSIPEVLSSSSQQQQSSNSSSSGSINNLTASFKNSRSSLFSIPSRTHLDKYNHHILLLQQQQQQLQSQQLSSDQTSGSTPAIFYDSIKDLPSPSSPSSVRYSLKEPLKSSCFTAFTRANSSTLFSNNVASLFKRNSPPPSPSDDHLQLPIPDDSCQQLFTDSSESQQLLLTPTAAAEKHKHHPSSSLLQCVLRRNEATSIQLSESIDRQEDASPQFKQAASVAAAAATAAVATTSVSTATFVTKKTLQHSSMLGISEQLESPPQSHQFEAYGMRDKAFTFDLQFTNKALSSSINQYN